MKAIVMQRQGGPDVLEYLDAPDPVAGPGEILVDIHAASVNSADTKVRAGGDGAALKLPHILGRDFSGVVSALGDGVTDFAVGDAVFGVMAPGLEGCYAEKVATQADIIARKPASLGHVEAAALAVAGLTSLWALEDTAKLRAGETILIQGGAGGVAGFAIQLAKHLGARVITTASASNHDYVRSLGADQAIDYRSEDFTKLAGPCDVVFDTVGGDVQARSYEVLKPGGRLVWVSRGPSGFTPPADRQTLRPAVLRDRAHLERILRLVDEGAVWPPTITRYPPSKAADAHRVVEGRHLQGKLVLEVRG